jgi:hypothetical protein
LKTLSIRHPWIDLILAGLKTIEVRSWATGHRGYILLHAGATLGRLERAAYEWLRRDHDIGLEPPATPRSGIVGAAEVVEVRRLGRDDLRAPFVSAESIGEFAWVLRDVRPINLVPCPGRLGLFRPPADVELKALPALGFGDPREVESHLSMDRGPR